MFERIIVPLDGTPFAEAALEPACALASLFRSRILVTRAIVAGDEAPLPCDDNRCEANNGGVHLENVNEADAYLREMVERLRGAGYEADFTLYIGEPGTGITKIARLSHADLIVMNMRLRWQVDPTSRNPGSVTLRVLKRTRTPILCVHLSELKPVDIVFGDIGTRIPPILQPETPIILPLDGSSLAEQAIAVAESLARASGSYLVLVRAIAATDASLHGSEDVDALHSHIVRERDARTYMASAQALVERHGIRVATRVERGTPASVIEHIWRESGAGLIVLASHGCNGHHGTLIGSVAASLLEESEAPILITQPADVPADDRRGYTEAMQLT